MYIQSLPFHPSHLSSPPLLRIDSPLHLRIKLIPPQELQLLQKLLECIEDGGDAFGVNGKDAVWLLTHVRRLQRSLASVPDDGNGFR